MTLVLLLPDLSIQPAPAFSFPTNHHMFPRAIALTQIILLGAVAQHKWSFQAKVNILGPPEARKISKTQALSAKNF